MNEILFVVLLGTLGFASTCIGLLKDYRDKRYTRNWLKGMKKEFFILMGIGICILILSVWQYFYTKNEIERDRKIEAAEQKRNDSLLQSEIKKGIDSGIQMMSQGFGKSFKEQNIKMDSLNFTLVKIRDSVNAYKPEPFEDRPTLEVPSNGITIDSPLTKERNLQISITSIDGGSTNLNIRCWIITLKDNGQMTLDLVNDELLDKDDRIPKGINKNIRYTVISDAKIEKIYLLLKGTYTNLNGKNKASIDALYEYNLKEKSTKKLFAYKKKEILAKVNLE